MTTSGLPTPPRRLMDGVAGTSLAPRHTLTEWIGPNGRYRATGIGRFLVSHETETGFAQRLARLPEIVPGPRTTTSSKGHTSLRGPWRFGRSLVFKFPPPGRKKATFERPVHEQLRSPPDRSLGGGSSYGNSRDGAVPRAPEGDEPSLPIGAFARSQPAGLARHAVSPSPRARVRPLGGLAERQLGRARCVAARDRPMSTTPPGRRPGCRQLPRHRSGSVGLWVNFFDTAPGYASGGARATRRGTRRRPRDGRSSASKFGTRQRVGPDWSASSIEPPRAELEAVADDYLEIVLLHSPPPEAARRKLASLRRAGPPAGVRHDPLVRGVPSISGRASTSW